jgi:hypothetical protein
MATEDPGRELETFRAAHRESVDHGRALFERAGIRGDGADWLRSLPPAVRERARELRERLGPLPDDDVPALSRKRTVSGSEDRPGVRLSLDDFAYRTLGR